MNMNQVQAVLKIAAAVIETIRESGSLGAPGGTIYAALMSHGCTLQQFDGLMAAIVGSGKVSKRGEFYFAN